MTQGTVRDVRGHHGLQTDQNKTLLPNFVRLCAFFFFLMCKENYEEAGLPQILNELVQRLLEEEDTDQDRVAALESGDETRYCLMHFLQSDAFSLWCEVATNDVSCVFLLRCSSSIVVGDI